MPSLPRANIKQALQHKFEMDLLPGGDHRRYRLMVGGKKVVGTQVSTGTNARTVPSNLVSAMARQLSVQTSYFVEMVSCTKSKDQYLMSLKEAGLIPETTSD